MYETDENDRMTPSFALCRSSRVSDHALVWLQQVCRSSLLSGQYVRLPRRMLPPGESQ